MRKYKYISKQNNIQNLSEKYKDLNTTLINRVPSSINRQRQNFDNWRSAIQAAENESNPSYYRIMSTFQEISEDSSVFLNQNIRENGVLSSEYCFYKNDKEDEKIEEFFETKWFREFLKISMESIFYGYSLIQIKEIKDDRVVDIESVWRQNINPKSKMILSTPHVQTGVNFEKDEDISPYLIFVSPKDSNSNYLGLYNICAPYTISKRNAISGNNQLMAKHGIPSIIYKSDIQEEIYIQNIESYLSNFSNNSYIFANKSDDISLIEASNSSNQSFRDTISDSNKEIGEIICGSNISSQQSFVGSAEVHERLLTMYTESDKRFLETVVNDQLIPKLIGLGLTFLEGVIFGFEEEEEDNTALFAKTVQLLQLGYSVDPQWIADNFGIPVVSPTIINSGDISKNNSEEDV